MRVRDLNKQQQGKETVLLEEVAKNTRIHLAFRECGPATVWLTLSPATFQGDKTEFSEVEMTIYKTDNCDLKGFCHYGSQGMRRLFKACIWPSTPFANCSLIPWRVLQRWEGWELRSVDT